MKTRFYPVVLSLLASLGLPLACAAHPLTSGIRGSRNNSVGPGLSVWRMVREFCRSWLGGVVAVSTNGTNWSASFPASKTLTDMHLRRGKFVAVGDKGTIVTSTNVINWEDHSTDTNLYCGKLCMVIHGSWLWVTRFSPAFNYSLVSTDGNTWTSYLRRLE